MTTIWERCFDGTVNKEGMNSLNHYAYGAIVEWIYREAILSMPFTEERKALQYGPHIFEVCD